MPTGELDIQLSTSDQNKVNGIITSLKGMTAKGEEVVDLLNNAEYFQALYNFMVMLEAYRPRTYRDTSPNHYMTIGIGFNLNSVHYIEDIYATSFIREAFVPGKGCAFLKNNFTSATNSNNFECR